MATKQGFGFSISLDISKFEANCKKLSKQLDSTLGANIMSLSRNAVAALGGITAAFATIGAAAIKFGSQMDTLQTVLDNTWKSALEAKNQYSALRDIAENSDFGMNALVNVDKTMANLGFNAKESAQVIERLGNVVVAMGGTESDLQSLADSLLKMKTTGKVSARALQQFAKAGIEVADVAKMNASDAINTLIDRMQQFNGVMRGESTDIWTQFPRAVEICQDALAQLGNYINDNFKGYVVAIVDVISDARDAFSELLSNPDGLKSVIAEIEALGSAIMVIAIPQLTKMAIAAAPLIIKIGALAVAIYALRTVFKDVFQGNNNLGKAIASWAVIVDESITFVTNHFKELPKILEMKAKEAVVKLGDALRSGISSIFDVDIGKDWLVEDLRKEVIGLKKELQPLEAETEKLKSIVKGASDDAGEHIDDFSKQAAEDFNKIIDVVEKFNNKLSGVKNGIVELPKITGKLSKITANGGKGKEGKEEQDKSFFGALEPNPSLVEEWTDTVEKIKTKVKEATNGIKEEFISIGDWCRNLRKSIADGFAESLDNLLFEGGNVFDKLGEKLQELGKQILQQIAKMLVLTTIFRMLGIHSGTFAGITTVSSFSKEGVGDGIIQNGKVISTHPDDYIIATKDPSSLGGKANVVVNVNNNSNAEVTTNSYFDGTKEIIDIMIDGISRNVSGSRDFLRSAI